MNLLINIDVDELNAAEWFYTATPADPSGLGCYLLQLIGRGFNESAK